MMAKYILGISAFYHDSAACLLRDGEIIAAAQEGNCSEVLSEDMNDGQNYGGVKVVNPFVD